MNVEKLKDIAQEIQWRFESKHKGVNTMYLSEKTCMVLAFSQYVSELNCCQLQQDFSLRLNASELQALKKILRNGIEKYLADNIKTLALR